MTKQSYYFLDNTNLRYNIVENDPTLENKNRIDASNVTKFTEEEWLKTNMIFHLSIVNTTGNDLQQTYNSFLNQVQYSKALKDKNIHKL